MLRFGVLRPDEGPGEDAADADEASALSRAEMGLEPRVGVAPGVKVDRIGRGGVADILGARSAEF